MSAVKRKTEKSHTKDRKEHKKPRVTKEEKKAKRVKPPTPEPESSDEELEDDDEVAGDEMDIDEDESGEEEKSTAGGEKVKDPAQTAKAKESRQEQKRLASERKQAKPMGDIIHRAKRIWEQLRRREAAPADRQKLIAELTELVRGRIKDLVFKHDASRVVQTALKYGNKEVRAEIAQGLKGTYVDLSQSSYGKYLVVKVMHYGTPETKKMVVEEFCGNVRKLIKHREASFVIEDCFREYATREQKARLLREFYGLEFAVFKSGTADPDPSLSKILEKSPEKRAVIMKNLLELLNAVAEKGAIFFSIVHRAMLEFISNTTSGTTEATEFLELVKEHVGEIAFTKDGAQTVMHCLALGTAKDRKIMIKSLKPVADTLAAHESGYLVLLTAFDVVDDTVLVSKTLFPELQPHLFDLAIHKFGRIPLLYPFVGRLPRLLTPSAIKSLEATTALSKATSKKDPAVRTSELRAHLSPIALQGIIDHASQLVQDSFGCQFITEVLLGADGEKTAALSAVADLAAADPGLVGDADKHFAASAAGGRMLKALALGGHYSAKEKRVQVIEPPLGFGSLLYSKISSNISSWATGAMSFVVVGLLEAEGFAEKESLKTTLRKCSKTIRAAAEKGNKGSQVILGKL